MPVSRRLVPAIAVTMAALLAGAAPAVSEEPFKVATEASFPPFSKTEADGSITGFEIDLGSEVCKRAKLECQWVKQDFDGMIAALLARKFDFVFSSMAIRPDRQKVADFSIPYYFDPLRFYGSWDAARKFPDEIDGKKIGLYAGGAQESLVKKLYGGRVEIVGYKNLDQVHADLVAGRIDLAFGETIPAGRFLASAEGKPFSFVGGDYIDREVVGVGKGAMFRKGSDELRERINKAIREVYADGTFDRLSEAYFPGLSIRTDKFWE
jgi:ABC-type amino acid transport substrate-binding protein